VVHYSRLATLLVTWHSQSNPHAIIHKIAPMGTYRGSIARLRYALEGDRPNQTVLTTRDRPRIVLSMFHGFLNSEDYYYKHARAAQSCGTVKLNRVFLSNRQYYRIFTVIPTSLNRGLRQWEDG